MAIDYGQVGYIIGRALPVLIMFWIGYMLFSKNKTKEEKLKIENEIQGTK